MGNLGNLDAIEMQEKARLRAVNRIANEVKTGKLIIARHTFIGVLDKDTTDLEKVALISSGEIPKRITGVLKLWDLVLDVNGNPAEIFLNDYSLNDYFKHQNYILNHDGEFPEAAEA